jgi:hypothetical protein
VSGSRGRPRWRERGTGCVGTAGRGGPRAVGTRVGRPHAHLRPLRPLHRGTRPRPLGDAATPAQRCLGPPRRTLPPPGPPSGGSTLRPRCRAGPWSARAAPLPRQALRRLDAPAALPRRPSLGPPGGPGSTRRAPGRSTPPPRLATGGLARPDAPCLHPARVPAARTPGDACPPVPWAAPPARAPPGAPRRLDAPAALPRRPLVRPGGPGSTRRVPGASALRPRPPPVPSPAWTTPASTRRHPAPPDSSTIRPAGAAAPDASRRPSPRGTPPATRRSGHTSPPAPGHTRALGAPPRPSATPPAPRMAGRAAPALPPRSSRPAKSSRSPTRSDPARNQMPFIGVS